MLHERGNGIVHVAVDLAIEQSRAGHAVTVAAPSGDYVDLLRTHGVRHVSLPQTGGANAAVAVFRLASLVRRDRTDIVHAHMVTGAFIGYSACTLTATRLITTVHNSWQRQAIGMRLGDHVIAVSDAVRRDMIQRGIPAAKITTVLNGTLGSARMRAATGAAPPTLDHPAVLTVAGLNTRKGIADLIEAAVILRERVPGVKVYLAGDGPERAQFQQLARDRGVEGTVVFLGFCRDAEGVMRQADVFVLASHADPNPLVIPEARAAGLPIVATAVGGIPESLDGGSAGLLVPPRAPRALADALARVLTDTDLRDRMRDQASSNLGWLTVGRMTDDTLAVYRVAIGRLGR
ncbi:MAG: glycosyltransferase family 4 protein [Gemmatimonadaceae bacterium]